MREAERVGDLLPTIDNNLSKTNCNKMKDSITTSEITESRQPLDSKKGSVCVPKGKNNGASGDLPSVSDSKLAEHDAINDKLAHILASLRAPCSKHTLDVAILQLCACAPAARDFVNPHPHNAHNPHNPPSEAIPTHDLTEVAKALADRIYELLHNGTICELEYIGVFWVLRTLKSPLNDTRFAVFLEQMQPFSDGLSEIENLLFLQVCSVAMMFVYGAEEGMKFFIAHMCLLDMNLPQSEGVAEFCIKHFPLLGVDFTLCLEALAHALHSATTLSPKRRRSLFNWQLHCLWNIEGYFNNTRWLELYPAYKAVFYALLDRTKEALSHDMARAMKCLDEVLYAQFFLYHMCGNSFHTQEQWREFCAAVDSRAAAVYEEFAPYMDSIVASEIIESKQPLDSQKGSASAPKNNGGDLHTQSTPTRQIIGILKDRIVGNSPYKVEFSLFSNLLRDKSFASRFRLKIYNMALIEKSSDDEALRRELEGIGVEICDVVLAQNTKGFYNSHLSKALLLWEAIRADGVRCLISPNNGYGISDFLLSVRVAPVQAYYSHGNFVYDIPSITHRLTHICNAQRRITHCGFGFIGVSVKMDTRFYNPPVDSRALQALRAQYPHDVKILGTIGRLVKLDSPQYLKSVLEIMRSFPQSVYLACGGGNEWAIREKIVREGGADLLHRFCFSGYVDSALYGHIIDLWLDSFPLEQGESRIEYVAKGGVALVLSKESKQEREERISRWVEQYTELLTEFLALYNAPAPTSRAIALTNLTDVKNVLCECAYVVYDVQAYEQRALEILRGSSWEVLRAQSLLEREILDFVRERVGVQSFMEVIESAGF